MPDNFQRMIHLVTEFFDVKNDSSQLNVDEKILEKLKTLHEATLSEEANDDGPIAWILIIPTTHEVMEHFLQGKITERELLNRTHPGQIFEAIYLCSATVLPEFRNKGVARTLTVNAISKIRKDHPVRHLYFWKFSKEGEYLAKAIGEIVNLPVLNKTDLE